MNPLKVSVVDRWRTVPTAGYRQRLRIAKGEASPTAQVASPLENRVVC